MTKSAFGVESPLAKGRFTVRVRRPKAPAPVKLDFKPIKPGVTPSGPGSARGRMDPSAHETRLAAERRELGKGLVRRTTRTVGLVGRNADGTIVRDQLTHAQGNWALKSKTTRRRSNAFEYPAPPGYVNHARGETVRVTGGGLTPMGAAAAETGAGLTMAGGAAVGIHRHRKGAGQVGKSAFGVEL